MLFDKNFDRSLWLIIASDKVSRERIGRIISFLPQEEYDQLQKEIEHYYKNKSTGDVDRIVFNKTFVGKDDFNYYFRVQICSNELNVKICRWIEKSDRLEEDYELNLVSISNEDLVNMEYLKNGYIGSYSQEFNRIHFVDYLTSVDTAKWNRDYCLLRVPLGYISSSILGRRIFKVNVVNALKRIPNDMVVDDFSSQDKRNELVRRRKKK